MIETEAWLENTGAESAIGLITDGKLSCKLAPGLVETAPYALEPTNSRVGTALAALAEPPAKPRSSPRPTFKGSTIYVKKCTRALARSLNCQPLKCAHSTSTAHSSLLTHPSNVPVAHRHVRQDLSLGCTQSADAPLSQQLFFSGIRTPTNRVQTIHVLINFKFMVGQYFSLLHFGKFC